MANAKLRPRACGGPRELNSAELTLVGGGRLGTGGGFLDVRGSDWYQNNLFGRMAARAQWRRFWGVIARH